MEKNDTRPTSVYQQLKSFQFHTARKLLFTWIRPTILDCNREALGLGTDDPVCFVLPSRSLADLLVVDKACEDSDLPRPYNGIPATRESRAFFFLGHPEGRLGRKTLRHQSPRMIRLFEIQHEITDAIKIVPVSLYWGHQPDQEKSMFKLILSENWSATSRFKKLLAMIFHPGHILVQFSTPVSLRDLVDSEPDQEKQIRKLLRLLRVQFNRQKRAIIGPDLSHRRTLINSIMTSEPVKNAIDKECERRNEKRSKVEALAFKYANEIASHQSYRVIRMFNLVLTWLWNRLYDGINVNNVEYLKEHASTCEVVYTPCHRSHVDYLLLSYVLYHNGLMPPHVAAGENLNLPVVGAFLRRGGAFFMRRSFRGDTLYRTVFDEYLHLMFVRGYSIEYFIEGGRSRSGRALVPRTGMLSMTIRSFQRQPSRPICLMPVYFGYERVIEASTYRAELAGDEKKAESLFDIVNVVRSLREPFGRVTVNFGKPVLLDQFLDEHLSDWRSPEDVAPRAFSRACETLSRQLVTRINRAAAINPVSLVATIMLCTPRQVIEERRLHRQLEVLLAIARDLTYSDELYVTPLPVADIVHEAKRISGIQRETQTFGTIYCASPDLSILLTWYRNNIAHVFALPSYIGRLIRSKQFISLAEIIKNCEQIYPYLQSEFFLPWTQTEVHQICRRYVGLLEQLDLVSTNGDQIKAATPVSDEYESLTVLAEIIEPTIERFFIVTALLSATDRTNIDDLEFDSSAIAEKMSTIYGINSPEFFERSLFSSLITALQERNIITVSSKQISINDGFSQLIDTTALTLDPDIRYNVLQAIQQKSS
ncbi:MAG: glycerol-3-phosphate 1-O-acyltransferase PlsB [Pseudomonadales bacterium]